MEEIKKEEEKNEVKINNNVGENQIEEKNDGMTIKDITTDEIQNKKIKNLTAIIILLAGIVSGSLFVDIAQFLTQSGYSQKALEKAEIFSAGEKTWVSFSDPAVELRVLSVEDSELEDCPTCDPSEVLYQLKRVIPTIVAKKVSASSEEGKKMIEKYQLNTIPSFVFSEDIAKTSFYSEAGVNAVFNEKDGSYILNSSMLGIQPGKYLEMPEMTDDDAVLGNKDAELKIIVFSDFQCPYSKMFYDIAKKVLPEYSEKTAFILRDLPLDFHPQAQNAAMASRCALEQNKFWELSDILYEKQAEWSEEEGKAVFKNYAAQVVGLDVTRFNQCLEDDKYIESIKEDKKVAEKFGISGTPSGFIGDQFMGGVLQEEQFKQTIDSQLEKK
jgi:protein-disulfide isomerase